ncbi:hypothetical protein Tco_0641927 [Tanacetum coccineum]
MLTPHHCSLLCSPLLVGTRKPTAFKPSACATKKRGKQRQAKPDYLNAEAIERRSIAKKSLELAKEPSGLCVDENLPKLETPVFGVNEDEHVKEQDLIILVTPETTITLKNRRQVVISSLQEHVEPGTVAFVDSLHEGSTGSPNQSSPKSAEKEELQPSKTSSEQQARR